MEHIAKILVAGHRALVGAAIGRRLRAGGLDNGTPRSERNTVRLMPDPAEMLTGVTGPHARRIAALRCELTSNSNPSA